MARADVALSGPFLAELTRRLQGQGPHFALVNTWLEQRMSEDGSTVEQLVRADGQAQASDQVSIGNGISGLRGLSSTNWRDFVEAHSVVERELRTDPAGVYPKMDFTTRDRYRHVVEVIARRSRSTELAVAQKANQLAEQQRTSESPDRASHVGYYLIGRGRGALTRSVAMRGSPALAVRNFARAYPLAVYFSGVFVATAVILVAGFRWAAARGAGPFSLSLLFIPALQCAAQIGIAITNWLATLFARPRPLPRMDFSDGIPAGHRTMVVVPTMLSSIDAIENLLDGLEVRYLGNRDKNLYFALLTDLNDAAQELTAGDEPLVRAVHEGIERLNHKYSTDDSGSFFLFHRARKWNPQEQIWMGYERKRGKIGDLNATLRGATDRFADVVGETSVLRDVRYVITLDTDTQLPRDAAREMAAVVAHPLNRPVFDPARRRVVDGYGILQPRMGASLPGAQRSLLAQLASGDAGIDPYTQVVSDLYQDLFGEGSFIGKGIYDVDAFEQSCGRFPENAILSHDLLESVYARSALLSDVELYEDSPSHYRADVSRRHRWMRGDWQIAWWLLPWVPGLHRSARNPISILSWWKIFDNLRRSLVAPAAMMLLIVAAFASAPLSIGILLLVAASLLAAPILATLTDLLRKSTEATLGAHLLVAAGSAARHTIQLLQALVFLPYDAYINLDAIVRTWARVLVTKHKLLEWKTSSASEQDSPTDLFRFVQFMWIVPAFVVTAILSLLLIHRAALPFAAPLLGLWLSSPIAAWWLSRPLAPPAVRLSVRQVDFLRILARRTWRFFEVFVTAQENWLPPDNFQEHSNGVIASRTSPTNIGMALLANLAAYDFGYCPVGELLERTEQTLKTLARMDRYRGHLYNWYDTRSLKPLPPRYVSMVDSGNLVGHLLVLRSGLIELAAAAVCPPRLFSGLRDTLLGNNGLHQRLRDLVDELDDRPRGLAKSFTLLERCSGRAAELAAAAGDDSELKWWASAFARTCLRQRADLTAVAAWASLEAPPENLWSSQDADQNSRLVELRRLMMRLDAAPTLNEVASLNETALPLVEAILENSDAADPLAVAWLRRLHEALAVSSRNAADRIVALEQLADECQELATVDFSFMFDTSRELFSIGFNVDAQRLDDGFYDLLATEARLGSYVVIAQGQVSQEHWFAMGRQLTATGGVPALLSWSGSMFEYLMPLLVMPSHEKTLLAQTYQAIVDRQIRYGRQRGVPWGISESGYNTIDLHLNYQYRAFGVPGLGLKRGLAEDLVIAPYASALALMVTPDAACRNLQRLDREGLAGDYGMFEAVDYTPSRLPPDATQAIVQEFMAHHQGMSLLAFAHVLLNKPMQRRFCADPMLRVADLLLQERVPKTRAPIFPHTAEVGAGRSGSSEQPAATRVLTNPNAPVPEVHLLSNGRYHVAITSAGGGYSRWRDLAVTRWREDATRDAWGTFCYVRDIDSGAVWSTAWHPTLKPSKTYEAIFTQARAEFRRRDDNIDAHTVISVSPEDDIELRRITLTNRSESVRTIEVTTYAEVVLAPHAHDLSHPAFSNLFVQTEWVPDSRAILATRRARSADERPPWMLHLMTVRGTTVGEASFETDRAAFLGRDRTPASPAALDADATLSGSEGPVLDPSVSIRYRITLQPEEAVQVDVVIGVAETREGAIAMAEKYRDPSLADRVFELAWTHSQILLRQLNATESEAQAYSRLAGSIIFGTALRRATPDVLSRNRRGQSGLWGYGISGDLPIVLIRVGEREKLKLIQQAVQAHAYWRMKGLAVDLVIWNDDESGYRQHLQDEIMGVIAASPEASLVDKPGGIFVRRGEQMSEEDRILLQTVARVVLVDDGGTLTEQVERRGRTEIKVPPFTPVRRRTAPPTAAEVVPRDLAFFNGIGGFSQDGREYVIMLPPGESTPAPWVNVIANPQFGTVVSASGSSYTWCENSHEFRLTPWHNDAVSDTCGEAIYIRDEETGRFFSSTPLPARGHNPYVSRHGFGYSAFEYAEDGIICELLLYVATDAPVKCARLRISNRSGRLRQLSITGYWEWVLGELRDKTQMHVVTELDPISGAMFARNAYSPEFAGKIVFVDSSETLRTITGDRTEFLGRNGSAANPAAMRRVRLSGRVGAGLDPCAAMQVYATVDDGQDKEIVFVVGAGDNEDHARQLAQRFRGTGGAQQAVEGVWHYWSRTLGVVYVETPDQSINFLVNGWLIYQTLACRMWARTGFYQSGGAFGFRDQLQDGMALVHAEPALLREHLLRAASRQFREGDVQHWWHPPGGRGVRTHFSDDYLWLPYAVCRYVRATGDTGVLDERIPFLTARPLRPDEESYYDLHGVSDEVGSLYDHCIRAIEHGLRFGSHGLPLMGCGDWNDGMNLVGAGGKGESVWLAFFLYDVLTQFAALARQRGDEAVAERYALEADRLRGNVDQHAWDGEWYRRAYFDDGEPLGSASNPECQIDALPQAWSVLSDAGRTERSRMGLENVSRRLVRRSARLIQLLDPPFDKSPLNPGYIKGYVPGVRENGGQYTHAAIWTVMAFAEIGDVERAWELFSLINPITHGSTLRDANVYRVEPYVIAADTYAVPPHTGRGGWTWSTGSAGWMYRLLIESLLGLHLEIDQLRLSPRVPKEWRSFKIHYRYRETFYHITIHNGGAGAAVKRVFADGVERVEKTIPLVDDRAEHEATIELE
jgi:cellobiose phosphorylase